MTELLRQLLITPYLLDRPAIVPVIILVLGLVFAACKVVLSKDIFIYCNTIIIFSTSPHTVSTHFLNFTDALSETLIRRWCYCIYNCGATKNWTLL